ncbi:MAG TPA: ABC transporter ATP-binding protein [Streptosporangiaceae bacterium]|nr:ABC transporter ATP-binding protein [Streptosporangiaceae bacterium]
MTTAPAGLAATGLHKAFGRQPVLTGLDLNVPAGTLTAVLGPSGSGKTTLLRILAGFERPERGSVTIGDVIVDDKRRHVPAERRRVGYVSQEGSLFPHLTVEANVGFGVRRRQRHGPRVGDLLDAVGLTGLARRYPHQLSGGQQQRVALARALAVGPRIVLLDEPFASLDASLRAQVRADVHAILRQAETTAVVITHDQDEALSIANLVAVIRGGKIAQLAPPQDLYFRPADPDLACFVGEANLIDGVADGGLACTPFGVLAVHSALPAVPSAPVTLLVRPEQVEVRPGAEGPGVPGRVLSSGFYGHDAVIRVAPDPSCLPSPIIARVPGHLRVLPGSAIRIGVRGPVIAWPRHRPADTTTHRTDSVAAASVTAPQRGSHR